MKSVLNNRLQISDNDKITLINVSCGHVLCSTYLQQLPSFLLQDIRNTTLATYQNKSLDPMIRDLTIHMLILFVPLHVRVRACVCACVRVCVVYVCSERV